jgi:hypothetical protein
MYQIFQDLALYIMLLISDDMFSGLMYPVISLHINIYSLYGALSFWGCLQMAIIQRSRQILTFFFTNCNNKWMTSRRLVRHQVSLEEESFPPTGNINVLPSSGYNETIPFHIKMLSSEKRTIRLCFSLFS